MTEERRPFGRPTKYEPRFCEELEQAMFDGYSVGAFAGMIGVSRATIDNWSKEHPEFLEALSRGKNRRLFHWEKAALRVAESGGGPGTATIITFGLKNMGGDEWSDKQQVEMTGKDGGPIQSEVTIDASDAFSELAKALDSVGRAKASGSSEAE